MVLGVSSAEQEIISTILAPYRQDYRFYYYGSRVKGTFEPTSDLDILIKGQTAMPLSVLADIKEQFDQSRLPYVVNFSDYHNISADFYRHIEKDLILYDSAL
jgi:predicted nucleotidyltransferase